MTLGSVESKSIICLDITLCPHLLIRNTSIGYVLLVNYKINVQVS